jgi:hypothetical protein
MSPQGRFVESALGCMSRFADRLVIWFSENDRVLAAVDP